MTTEVINSKVQFQNIHQDLIEKCISGDQKAQFQIYKLYYKAMYNISLRIVNNPMEAEDIMQESFLSAFEKINTFSGTVSFGAWLKKIVVNRSIDAIRRDRKVIFEDIDSLPEIEPYCYEDEPGKEETTQRIQEVMAVINRLPEECRIVFSLFLLEGYDHDEIGEILSISPTTSRSQFSRARQRLITELNRASAKRSYRII
ncbi:MAG: sigma-70 family RNA polymerase sigma factor [Bacteroidetes bacterium]|nr:MAG: sigma-70 family RNA polymerase sigma factor [Bacteroidota bacterium]